ncbi:uncharacterized protein LOC123535640 [Mercenaria mercenaria]|uniref:uncharacterized protein LOC123535640 n=1 Tax=Mercenaria mercenaria TaxID=6596 RepID=UPI00234EC963|nr:uncharacterized protein LOC123535640 [Mercenaria mercenaria]
MYDYINFRMFKVPDWYLTMSMGLSEVLDEIGVNERMIMKRRRTNLLEETMMTIANRLSDIPSSDYFLGSQSEGTTTVGLQSDWDVLTCNNEVIVIQDLPEWAPDLNNILMIEDATTPPGYCLLQTLRQDVPLPETVEYENCLVRDTHGRILFKNTIIDAFFPEGQRHGPAGSKQGRQGFYDQDIVFAFPLKGWPKAARHWLHQQGRDIWPTEDMQRPNAAL